MLLSAMLFRDYFYAFDTLFLLLLRYAAAMPPLLMPLLLLLLVCCHTPLRFFLRQRWLHAVMICRYAELLLMLLLLMRAR